MPKTVFILGAGASAPYGFPSGERLVELIIEKLSEVERNQPGNYSPPIKQMLTYKITSKQLIEFKHALSKSGAYSIDSFLSARREFREIGKYLIAYVLLEFEEHCLKEKLLYHSSENWYRYFFNEIRNQDFFDFCIYTFNYDRSLEYYLIEAYRNFYNMDEGKIFQRLKSMNIVHLHGSLGSIEHQHDINRLNFGNTSRIDHFDYLENLSERIEIIYEVNEGKFANLWNDLSKCTNIVFLGFGFDETNMNRIKLDSKELSYFDNKIYSTTYKLSPIQVEDRLIKYINIDKSSLPFAQPLQERPIDKILIARNETALQFFTNTLSTAVYKTYN